MFARTNPGVQLSFIYWWDLLIWISWNAVTCWKVSGFSEVMNSWSFRRFPPPRRSCAIYVCSRSYHSWTRPFQNVPWAWGDWKTSTTLGCGTAPQVDLAKTRALVGCPPSWYSYVGSSMKFPNSLGSWPSYLGHPWPLFRTAPKRQTTFLGEDLEDWRTRGPLWECSTWCFLPICRSGGRRCSLCHPFGCWTQGTGATARVGAPCPKVWTLAGTGGMC